MSINNKEEFKERLKSFTFHIKVEIETYKKTYALPFWTHNPKQVNKIAKDAKEYAEFILKKLQENISIDFCEQCEKPCELIEENENQCCCCYRIVNFCTTCHDRYFDEIESGQREEH